MLYNLLSHRTNGVATAARYRDYKMLAVSCLINGDESSTNPSPPWHHPRNLICMQMVLLMSWSRWQMCEVTEGCRVRLFCLYEHVTLLKDSRWATRIGQRCSENTGSLVRLSVSLRDVANTRQSSWRLYPDVAFSWKTASLSLPLDPTLQCPCWWIC